MCPCENLHSSSENLQVACRKKGQGFMAGYRGCVKRRRTWGSSGDGWSSLLLGGVASTESMMAL